MKRSGMGSHQSTSNKKDEWMTPPEIIQALGRFDLDPCSNENHPWPIADMNIHLPSDGTKARWFGRVFLNPPYTTVECDRWLRLMVLHGRGTALIFARTETRWFFKHIWNEATAILFIEGRLHFHHTNGIRAKANSGAPSCLVAYGKEDAEILKHCGIKGKFIQLQTP
jgi:hypothetical protein